MGLNLIIYTMMQCRVRVPRGCARMGLGFFGL